MQIVSLQVSLDLQKRSQTSLQNSVPSGVKWHPTILKLYIKCYSIPEKFISYKRTIEINSIYLTEREKKYNLIDPKSLDLRP